MIPLNKHDLALLHILSSKRLAVKALKTAKRGLDLFPPRQMPHLDILWRHLVTSAVESKKSGTFLDWDRADFVAQCLEDMRSSDMLDENKARLQAICEQYLSNKEFDEAQGEKYLLEEINESVQRQISRAITNSEPFDALRKLVSTGQEIREDVKADRKEKTLFVNPLDNVVRYLHKMPKLASGVKHFDKATNGGMSEQEIALIAGLSGGGKSMSAVELVGSQILLGRSAAWFTYEQPFDQDMMQRMVAFITGYSLDLIRGCEFEDLPDDVRIRFSNIATQVKNKLLAADFSSNEMLDEDDPDDDGSVYSIRKRLEMWASVGNTPDYIMFDWLGAAVKRIATTRGVDISQAFAYTTIANDIVGDLVQLAKDFKTRIVFFHQLEPALKKSPPARKPVSTELQMVKTLTNWVNYAIVLGKRDENQRCWYICDKCRNGLPSEHVVELDGEHSRFKLLEGYQPGRNGQFINAKEIQEELSQEKSYQPLV